MERGTRGKERAEQKSFDVFLSYSRKDGALATEFSKSIIDSGFRPFIDTNAIKIGDSWQSEIFEALEQSKLTVVFYSPDYLASEVCKDEFAAAMILRRRRGSHFIFPMMLRQVELPAYMEMLNYRDCSGDRPEALQLATAEVVGMLSAKH